MGHIIRWHDGGGRQSRLDDGPANGTHARRRISAIGRVIERVDGRLQPFAILPRPFFLKFNPIHHRR